MVSDKSRIMLVVMRLCYVCNLYNAYKSNFLENDLCDRIFIKISAKKRSVDCSTDLFELDNTIINN